MEKEAKLLRCALLNGSAWSTERKYMKKIQRKMRYLLWDWHRLKEGGNGGASSTKRQRKDGDLLLMQRGFTE